MKYGITANLTADFTYNTDFAQVEIDEQQVNLTRFSLFFPEKRDFFLEGRGIFDFARGGVTGAQLSAGRHDQHPAVPVLQPAHRPEPRPRHPDRRRRPADRQGRQVRHRHHEHPDRRRDGVARRRADQLLGRPRQARHPAAQQHRRDVHQPLESAVGARARTRPTASTRAFSFFQNVALGALLRAHRDRRACDGDDDSYQGRVRLRRAIATARTLEYLKVGDNFNPEVGFVARDDFRRTLRHRCASARGRSRSRRCASSPGRRTSTTSRTAPATLETRDRDRALQHRVREQRRVRRSTSPATTSCCCGRSPIARRHDPGGRLQVHRRAGRRYAFGAQRRVSGTVSLQAGQLLRRHARRAIGFSAARVSVLKQFSLEPTHLDQPRRDAAAATFTTTAAAARAPTTGSRR